MLHLTGDEQADRLLTTSPLALLLGMVLDQQIPLERAFSAPYALEQRLGGHLDASELASMDPGQLEAIFREKPALHRYPGSMAGRCQAVCAHLVEHFGGDAERLWSTASSGAELRRRLEALPGFGPMKAKIFLALLAKQLDVRPDGWQEVCEPYGEQGSYRSVADVVDADSLDKVRAFKAAMKQQAKAKA